MASVIGKVRSVQLWVREAGGAWFGVAACGEKLIAVSTGASRAEAERVLMGCIPKGAPWVPGDADSDFAAETVRMLAAIESGNESEKRFELAPEYFSGPAAEVYRLVAAVPAGYAASYGGVAAAAGTVAREVGRLMARNPLYPLVPCHRVVGSDYSLVGYRGKTSGPDLDDKMEKLRAEARGYVEERELPGGRSLRVFPVERVLERAAGKADPPSQLALF